MTRNGMQPDNLFYSVIDIQETFYKYFSADVSSLNRICRFLHLASSSSNTIAIFLFLVKACIWLELQVQPHVLFFQLLQRWYNTNSVFIILLCPISIISSNVNEVIRAILNFFVILYEKIFHAQKAQKRI